MLADEFAACLNQSIRSFFFGTDIKPGVGVFYIHCYSWANRFCTKIEGGETGNNFCIRESTDITHFCFCSGEFTLSN